MASDIPQHNKRQMFGHSGMTHEQRMHQAFLGAKYNKLIRTSQQSERGLIEFPHELVPALGGNPIRKACMTERDARLRSNTLRSKGLGFVWRRCAY